MVRDHPSIRRHAQREAVPPPAILDAAWLREIVLEAGADDVGFVELDRPGLGDDPDHVLEAFPGAVAMVGFVVRMARSPVISPKRSLSNLEFHRTNDRVNAVSSAIVHALEARGVAAVNPSVGFPMEMDQFPGRTWIVSHKKVAVQAGLGQMGIHRNVIHPRFGNFILIGTVIVDRPISAYDRPIDFNPCFECRLCVSACPVGAISDDHFDFQACYTHNYREFMGGFVDWIGTVADSADRHDYNARVSVSETASMWQSLSFGANYKAAYCMAVCPAGDDIIGRYLDDKKGFVSQIVRPLRDKEETVYVLAGSDAEAHVTKRFPHKSPKRVRSALGARDIDAFVDFAHVTFQRQKARDVRLRLHFAFRGASDRSVTVVVDERGLTIADGHSGDCDALVSVDADTWLGIISGRRHPGWAVVTGRLWVTGRLSALTEFQQCFPRP